MTEPSALSGALGILTMSLAFAAIYCFVAWIDPDDWDDEMTKLHTPEFVKSYSIQKRALGGWYVANPGGLIVALMPTKAAATAEMRRLNRKAEQ